MSKIVFVNIPAYGHVNVTLPVAQELVQRGEQVVYYNTEEFRSPIERTGASFRAYPVVVTSSAISAAIANGNMADVSFLLMSATERLLPFVLDELRREPPDLIVFDSMVLWGRMAAALLNIPAVTSHSTFVLDFIGSGLTFGESLRLLRQMLPKVFGLMGIRRRLSRKYGSAALLSKRPLFPLRGDLNLVFTARELQPDTPIIDETFRFVGPSINPQTRDGDFSFDVLGQGRVVYISLGTIHHNTDFYRQCFEAFGEYPAQFVLVVGKLTDINALGALPANFIVRPSVPQLEILQRAAMFITHGGINSVHEGLYYGVPLIVIPQQFEQLINAHSVEAQGAALLLSDQVMGGRITAAALCQALDAILSQSRYREAAARVQQILRATGGYRQAADEIQAFVAGKGGASSR